jgi:FKBP-type peptidyl-prolyl cis-trans isomerase FkpA
MKKLINLAAIVALAGAMVACSGKSYYEGVSKGSKSEVDSLSYAVGANFGYGIVADTPDLKFDWETLVDAAEVELFKSPAITTDEDHEAALKLLQEFFNEKRRPRMDERAAELFKEDSTRQLTREDFIDFDSFENDKERKEVSEAYGTDIGVRLRPMGLPLKTYWFKKGMVDAAKNESFMTIDDTQRHIQMFYMDVLPLKNADESKAWLADIEKQKGVQKTESGLLYRIDREGDEVKPSGKDMVKCNYEGKLRDGFVFDSSYERGEPAEFPLTGVIKGWTEGLQLVGQGGQITLWIPAELAYGSYGAGNGMIGPNEALEFKVELLEVVRTAAPEAPAAE